MRKDIPVPVVVLVAIAFFILGSMKGFFRGIRRAR